MFINIEMKGPRTQELKEKYDCALVANTVYELLIKYDMHNKFLVSSFNSDILVEIERVRERR
jgi:hypothetical protein